MITGRDAGVRLAAALARLFLRLYPRPFRDEVGAAVVRDVRHRAGDLCRRRGGVGLVPWLPGLCLSLVVNAAGVWKDQLGGGRGAWTASSRKGAFGSFGRLSRSISPLDVKLGVRMALKHPALSLVALLGMTVAVAIGAGGFGVIRGVTASPLPLDEGDRIVTILNVDRSGFEQAWSTHLHALPTWRGEVPALAELGAYRAVTRNIIGADGSVTPERVVEMTASGFRIARVPPLLGRTFDDADEGVRADPVVVIGHGVWINRFGGDPQVIGREIRIGRARHTVVGVMPRDFAFPVNDRLWIPWTLDASAFEPGRAPATSVFARLAPGTSVDEASAQLAAIAQRTAADQPETHARLTTRAFPYTQEKVWGPTTWILWVVQVLLSLLLVVIAVNVGALIYARTVTRMGEIAVRTAIGASRTRIVSQLFVEALVLSTVAAGLGFGVGRWLALRVGGYLRDSGVQEAPFWWSFELGWEALGYVLALAVLAAVIIGVVPALGATGRHLRARMQSVGAGASAPKLGRTWTALIVAQVAFAVAIVPVALNGSRLWAGGNRDTGYPLQEVLVMRAELDDEEPLASSDASVGASAARYVAVREELARRLDGMADVAVVAATETAPWEDPDLRFELDGPAAPQAGAVMIESASTGHRVGRSRVSPEFFEAMDLRPVAGRILRSGDFGRDGSSIVVNSTFVDIVLGGGSALGRRIRFENYGGAPGDKEPLTPWHTIVGVVRDHQSPGGLANAEARAYLPLDPASAGTAGLVVRFAGPRAGSSMAEVRRIAARLDPGLRLANLQTLETLLTSGEGMLRVTVLALAATALAVLLLAVAGLYALMSFTVARRHREIGIRAALGARPHLIMRGVLTRASVQLAVGVAIGMVFAGGVDRLAGGEVLGGRPVLFLSAVAALMLVVGFLAAWGPVRRGLRIQPTEALRAE